MKANGGDEWGETEVTNYKKERGWNSHPPFLGCKNQVSGEATDYQKSLSPLSTLKKQLFTDLQIPFLRF